jgi:hypothetical protein
MDIRRINLIPRRTAGAANQSPLTPFEEVSNMTGKEIVDLATSIVNRQESTTRSELLSFINSARKSVLRNQKIMRLQQYKTVPMVSGVIDMVAQSIKSTRMVEYDNGTTKAKLGEIFSRQQATDIYGDFATTGTPSGYLEEGTSLYILPVPTTGNINILGEFWPASITDSSSSSDITTIELGDAWAYLGAAAYFNAKGEEKKGQYWQQVGLVELSAYLEQDNKRKADNADIWRRRPFGIPGKGRLPATEADITDGKW